MVDEFSSPADGPVSRRSLSDAVFGFGLAIAAVVFLFVIAPAGITVPSSVPHLGVSPILLPIVMGTVVACLSLGFALQASLGRGVPQDPDSQMPKRRFWPLRMLVVVSLIAAYFPLSGVIGMPGTAGVITAALMALGGERRVLPLVLIPVGFPALVTAFFTEVASVPIPMGWLD